MGGRFILFVPPLCIMNCVQRGIINTIVQAYGYLLLQFRKDYYRVFFRDFVEGAEFAFPAVSCSASFLKFCGSDK